MTHNQKPVVGLLMRTGFGQELGVYLQWWQYMLQDPVLNAEAVTAGLAGR